MEWLETRVLLSTTKFAVIGDFGKAGQAELDVANLVKSWNPDFIVTTGDNNYDFGGANTIDQNIGQYYHDYIYHYTGGYGAGSPTRRFYPVLGNHDWGNSGANPTGWYPYRDYFDLPGNERYYDFVAGPVHFFMLDSDTNEPDGMTRNSVQATWLKNAMAASTSPHKVVMFHHASYSSSASHGSTLSMRWPFSQWGATLTLAGHDHTYERSSAEGITQIVNGIGGQVLYGFGTPIPESIFRYNANNGAQLVTADDTSMTLKLYSRAGALIETHTIDLTKMLPIVSVAANATAIPESGTGSFTVSRTGNTDEPLTVPISFSGGATQGLDYNSQPETVIIPANASSVNLPVSAIDDTLGEPAETLQLSITPTNAQYEIGLDASASISITDNDSGPSQLLFNGGSAWRYKDDNIAPASNWKTAGFDDASWSVGNARFGYGDPGMATTVNSGPSGARYITHYFRTTWSPANAAGITAATLNLLRDDGAIVYLNGSEVLRSNMPTGTVTASTLAPSAIGGTDETTFFPSALNPSLIGNTNTLAVELHQNAVTTSDAVFDLYITGTRDVATPVAWTGQFGFETAQSLAFQFSEPVSSLTGSDLKLTDLDANQPAAADFTVAINGQAAVFSANAMIDDGNYGATLPPDSYLDNSGNANASPFSIDFFVLGGDANRDRKVNTLDFNLLSANFGASGKNFSQGDFSYDASVTSTDFNILLSQFGKILPEIFPPFISQGLSTPVFSVTDASDDDDQSGIDVIA